MHVELDISGSKLSYIAGDHVAIFPVNDAQLVERVGELLQVDLHTVITLANIDCKLVGILDWSLFMLCSSL